MANTSHWAQWQSSRTGGDQWWRNSLCRLQQIAVKRLQPDSAEFLDFKATVAAAHGTGACWYRTPKTRGLMPPTSDYRHDVLLRHVLVCSLEGAGDCGLAAARQLRLIFLS
mmetsp:Transcript_18407/g.50521  ORF Transcript_18407/g.50521 Transcript_18407/m.50521 type:complete len:111 (+) Transcript_18407:1463-1795(+)